MSQVNLFNDDQSVVYHSNRLETADLGVISTDFTKFVIFSKILQIEKMNLSYWTYFNSADPPQGRKLAINFVNSYELEICQN